MQVELNHVMIDVIELYLHLNPRVCTTGDLHTLMKDETNKGPSPICKRKLHASVLRGGLFQNYTEVFKYLLEIVLPGEPFQKCTKVSHITSLLHISLADGTIIIY